MKTKTFVPGGAMGVLLKSKLPKRYAWAESLGLMRELRNRLRVRTAWPMSLSHSVTGNSGSALASPARK